MKRGAYVSRRRSPAYALARLSGQNLASTPVAGGERGISTGFGSSLLLVIRSQGVLSAQRMLLANRTIAADGWAVEINGTNANVKFTVGNGTSAIASPAYTFSLGDVGRILSLTGVYDAPAGLVRLYVNGLEVGAGTAFTGTYAQSAATTAQTMGGVYARSDFSAPGTAILDAVTFRGVPSAAQVLDFTLRARRLRALPDTLGGATITHRWSPSAQLRSAPRVPRKLYAARGLSTTSYLSTVSAGPLPGLAGGFSRSVRLIVQSLTAATTVAPIFAQSSNGFGAGHTLYLNGAGVLYWQVKIGTSTYNVTYQLTPADVGAPIVVSCGLDAANNYKLYVNGVDVGSALSLAGYTPATSSALNLGTRGGADYGAERVALLEFAGDEQPITASYAQQTFAATLSADKLTVPNGRATTYYDLDKSIRDEPGNAVPSQVLDRVGSAHLTRFGSPDALIYETNLPAMPSTFADLVTGAGADALTPTGAPTLIELDQAREGRHLRGVQGWSTVANHLRTRSTTTGIGASATAPHWLVVFGRLDALGSSAPRTLLGRCNNASEGSVMYIAAGGQAAFSAANAAGTFGTAALLPAFTAADVGQNFVLIGLLDPVGNVKRAWRGKVEGSPGVQSGFRPHVAPLQVGSMNTTTNTGGEGWTFWGAAGGEGAALPTAIEIDALVDSIERTGRIQSVPGGKTTWLVDAIQDCLDCGAGLPETFKDRIGSADLVRVGLDVSRRGSLVALTGFSSFQTAATGNYYSSPATGGLRGHAASFWFTVPVYWDGKITDQTRTLFSNLGAVTGFAGLNFSITGTNSGPDPQVLLAAYANGPGQSVAWTIPAALAGSWLWLSVRFTGGTFEIWCNGVKRAQLAGSYVVSTSTAPMALGLDARLIYSGAIGLPMLGAMGGDGFAVTDAELVSSYQASLAAGDLIGIPSKTSRLWSFKADVADAGGAVPATSKDRSGTSSEALTRTSPASGPVALGQRTERVWSYESAPLVRAVANPNTAGIGYQGAHRIDTGSQWMALAYAPGNLTANYLLRFMSSLGGSGNGGYEFVVSGGTSLIFRAFNSASFTQTSAPSVSTSSADVGKLNIWMGVIDTVALRVRQFSKRLEAGTGTALPTGYSPPAVGTPLQLGTVNGAEMRIFGLAYGRGAPTLAQYQALWDEVAANDGRLVRGIPNMTDVLYDVHADTTTDAAPEALTDRMGSGATLGKTGGVLYLPQYARALAA